MKKFSKKSLLIMLSFVIFLSGNLYSESPLFKYITKANIVKVKSLLNKGYNVNSVNSEKSTLLLYSLKLASLNSSKKYSAKQKSIINLLMSKKADVKVKDANDWTPLHYAVQIGNISIVKKIIKRGADLNSKNETGATPIFYTKNKSIIKFLINSGADINTKDKWGETVLFWACERGLYSNAVFLIRNKLNVNMKNDHGSTPLHKLAEYGNSKAHKKILSLLLNNKVKLNSRDSNGFTPLHYAILKGRTSMTKTLISKGAKINLQTEKQFKNISAQSTPLHIAIRKFDLDKRIVNLLLKKRVNLKLKDENNRTPIMLARAIYKESSKNWYGTKKYKKAKRAGIKKIIIMLKKK